MNLHLLDYWSNTAFGPKWFVVIYEGKVIHVDVNNIYWREDIDWKTPVIGLIAKLSDGTWRATYSDLDELECYVKDSTFQTWEEAHKALIGYRKRTEYSQQPIAMAGTRVKISRLVLSLQR